MPQRVATSIVSSRQKKHESARLRAMTPTVEYACNSSPGDLVALVKTAGTGAAMAHRLLPVLVRPCPLRMPKQELPIGLSRDVVAKVKDVHRRVRLPHPYLRDSAAGPPRWSRGP